MVFPRAVSFGLFCSCFILHPWVILKKTARDIDAWMTVNKLKMNRDKTELVVLNASHRQPSPLTSISVCDEVISKSSVATILVTNLETLVCVSPSPDVNLGITVSQCSKIHLVLKHHVAYGKGAHLEQAVARSA